MKGKLQQFRIGQGYDSHRLVAGRDLILGGVKIDFPLGLDGHSDADALIHAIIDALLGAATLGDIGTHFPDTQEAYKNMSSRLLLKRTAGLLQGNGFFIDNIDATVIIEKPRLAPYIEEMRKNIAADLGLKDFQVNIKAKSNEGMGFIGRGEGVAVQAVALAHQFF